MTAPTQAEAEKLAALQKEMFDAIRIKTELEEWHKLKDPIVLYRNLLSGIPARLTHEMLVHLIGEHGITKVIADHIGDAGGVAQEPAVTERVDEVVTQASMPDGYKRVPIDPTDKMIDAGIVAFQHAYNPGDPNADWIEFYKAAITAAPSPQDTKEKG